MTFYINFNTNMLSELSFRSKENCYRGDPNPKQATNLYLGTISALREEISSLKNQKHQLQKQWVGEVEVLRAQIKEYKNKLSSITDKYLMQTMIKDLHPAETTKDYEQMIREKDILIEHERDNRKKVQQKLQVQIQEGGKWQKQIEQLRMEKQKSMEISLLEKIDLEERAKLLEEEVESKKNIIKNIKKELDRIYSEKEALNKQERSLAQKSKELECYSKEINEYNRLNELKMRQQVCHLMKENQFLKDYVKKIEKLSTKECDCEAKDEKIRENMYQIKRQLALAKVKLGQNYFTESKKKKKGKEESSDSDSNYSFEQKRK